jgi:phosphoribosylaminoimidazole-succinocarboxamide synthase
LVQPLLFFKKNNGFVEYCCQRLTKDCPDLKLIARGKVRDVYEVDQHTILFIATDRISAFDVVMDSVIP